MLGTATYSPIGREVTENLARLQIARQQKTAAEAKMQSAQAKIQTAQAKIQSGQAKLDSVHAERERKCKIIHKKLDVAISTLNTEKANLEAIEKRSKEGDNLIKDIAAIVSRAIQLKTDAVPTISLQPVVAKLNEVLAEKDLLVTRVATFKAQVA